MLDSAVPIMQWPAAVQAAQKQIPRAAALVMTALKRQLKETRSK
jgi:hypothetical protein